MSMQSVQLHTYDFCLKNQHEVAHLVAGPKNAVHICDECIALAAEIVEEQTKPDGETA